MSLVFKIFMILYRLCLPGGLLLAVCFALIRLGVLSDRANSALAFFPVPVFVAGFVLSAVFRRSRIFFALLVLALAQATLAWTVPNLPARNSRALAEVISILLPLNLLVIAFLKERGIISPAGRKRLALAGLQVMALPSCPFRRWQALRRSCGIRFFRNRSLAGAGCRSRHCWRFSWRLQSWSGC